MEECNVCTSSLIHCRVFHLSAIGGAVCSVHVAAERKLLQAGSTIVEGLDRLFKLFWIFNMEYPAECRNVFIFLGHYVYKMKSVKKIPPTIVELCSFLSK
jgi:hypothetical protein